MADELTLDQLAAIPSDPEAEARTKQASRPPQLAKGTYNSVPELMVSPVYTDDTGRRSIKYFGQFTGVDDVAGMTGYGSFWISPDERHKEDGKPDLKTKLMTQAIATYQVVHGISPTESVDKVEVLKYLAKYSIGVRFLAPRDAESDSLAVAITVARE